MTTVLQSFAFLGPEGTFTEAALNQVPGVLGTPTTETAIKVPVGSVITALNMVREAEVDAAVVPIENSVEGGVTATLDAIAEGNSLQILREILVPISFVLLARPNSTLTPQTLDQVTSVSTHTHAWAQVRNWAEQNIKNAEFIPAASTAGGARGLLDEHTSYDAAVCAPHLAAELGLPVLASAIEDIPGAVTRFVLVARNSPLPEQTGSDKTTLVVPIPEDRPGALMQILDQFSTRGINLTRIESRPTGRGLGKYFFSIDLEGHLREQRLAAAMAALYRMFPGVKFLGSYPTANRREYNIPEYTTDPAYHKGKNWVQEILDR